MRFAVNNFEKNLNTGVASQHRDGHLENKETRQKKVKGDETYFAVVINDLDPFALGRNDPSTDGHIELSFRAGLDPHIIALKWKKNTNFRITYGVLTCQFSK